MQVFKFVEAEFDVCMHFNVLKAPINRCLAFAPPNILTLKYAHRWGKGSRRLIFELQGSILFGWAFLLRES